MGLFDFLKTNKNIITENGTNFIYRNDGKGTLKEKFIKVNGVLHGEYFKYDESGNILYKDYYHDGHIITLDEKQRIDDEKRRIENSNKEKSLNEYKNNICKLIEIDKIIFDVAYGNLIVQMTNATLLDFSRELINLFQDYLDEEFTKIYLFYKRNYLINKLIFFKEDEINLNQIFAEYLNNKKIEIDKEIREIGVKKPRYHVNRTSLPKERIIGNVFLELKRINYNHNISYLITSLSLNSFNTGELSLITNQDCELIGLEIEGYLVINKTIKLVEDELNSLTFIKSLELDIRNAENKIYQNILSICQQYKFYQGDISYNLENLNVQNLIKLSEINNLSSNDLYESGIEKDANSDYEGAIIDFTKAIEIDGEYLDAYRGRAYAKWFLRDYEGAISDYTKIIDFNPEDIDAYESRGRSKASLNDYNGAIVDFDKVIELDIESGVYSYRGKMKKNLLDFNGALLDYNIAVEKYPEDDSGIFGRGELKYETADYHGAIKDFNKCIEINPNRIMSFHKRGDCKLKIEDFNGAIEDYSIVVQNRQDKYGIDRPPSENATKLLASLYFNRGFARFKIKEYGKSIEDLKKAIELDPYNDQAIKLLESFKEFYPSGTLKKR